MDDLKDLREIGEFGISLGMGLGKSFEDGKLTVGDTVHFWEPIAKLGDASEGFQDAIAQYKSATPDQLTRLNAHLKEKFDLKNDKVEEFIESCMDAAFCLIAAATKGKALFSKEG